MDLKKLTSLTELPEEVKQEEFKPLSQSALNELKQKIKEAMIPLLIQIFHLRHAQAESMTAPHQEMEIVKKLTTLQKDLKQLSLWCTSCLTQIDKALSPPEVSRPKQCSASKKNSNLKFSQLHTVDNQSNSPMSLLEKLKNQKPDNPPPPRRSLIKVFSLAFSRNART